MSPSRIGALYALALVFSTLFDIIYLLALGIPIAASSISIADRILSAVIWTPFVLISAIAASIISVVWLFIYDALWMRNDTSRTGAASGESITLREIWSSICKIATSWSNFTSCVWSICKMLTASLLFVTCIIVTPWVIWMWLWKILTPYGISFFIEMLRAVMVAVMAAILLLVVILDVFFHIRISYQEKIMNFNRSRFMSVFSFAIFIFFLAFNIAILAYISKSDIDCLQFKKPLLTIDNKGIKNNKDPQLVLFRKFKNHFLVANCSKKRIEFLSTDEAYSIIPRE